MSINLSVTDFQKISNGDCNAGSITLTKSGKLDKVNNHVGALKIFNTKTISAETIFEVKNAFVKALRDTGISKEEIAKVREELGLPKDGGKGGLEPFDPEAAYARPDARNPRSLRRPHQPAGQSHRDFEQVGRPQGCGRRLRHAARR